MTKLYAIEHLVANIDIADRLGVGASVVSNWEKRDVGFPKPVGIIGRRPVWDWRDIEAWHRPRAAKAKSARDKRIAELRAELRKLEAESK